MSWIQKCLAVIAGVLILFEVTGSSLYSLLFQECITHRRTLQKVEQQLRNRQLALKKAEATSRAFDQRAQLNLASDRARARVIYQEYLVSLTETCSMTSVIINSSQPEKVDELGYVLHFSLQATGSTEQFGKLIGGLYQTNALHRISNLNVLQSSGPDSPVHTLTVDLALLVLSDANDNEGTLLAPSSLQLTNAFGSVDIFRRRFQPISQPAQSPLASGMEMLSSIIGSASAQLPATTTEPPPPSTELTATNPAPVPAMAEDPKNSVRLVGIIRRGATRYAIFYDGTRDIHHTVSENSELAGLNIDAQITQIREREIRLLDKDQKLELSLGSLYVEAVAR